MQRISISIPEYHLDDFKKNLSKLNKKVEKLGLPPITHDVVNETYHEREDGAVKFLNIEIDEIIPVLKGWTFLGKLDGVGINNVFYNVPGRAIPTSYYDVDASHCDHCGLSRKRNFTYIVQNAESGEYKQLGRQCLKDFIGSMNAEDVADILMRFKSFIDESENPKEPQNIADHMCFNVKTILCLAAHIIDEDGRYFSRAAAAEYGCESTGTQVQDWLLAKNDVGDIVNEGLEHANNVISYFAMKPRDDADPFMLNIISAVTSIYCSMKAIPIVVAALPVYHKEHKVRRNREVSPSSWIGVINARMKRHLILKHTITYYPKPTVYDSNPVGYIHIFNDSDGNVLKWFTGSFLEPGEYDATFTIKSHDEYKNTKETVITRLRI